MGPYYQEGDYEWYEPQEEFVDASSLPHGAYATETNLVMLLGPGPR